MVEKFHFDLPDHPVNPGAFVAASDYDALAAWLADAERALREIAKFGKRNSGCGYSCARMAEEALRPTDSATDVHVYAADERAFQADMKDSASLSSTLGQGVGDGSRSVALEGVARAKAFDGEGRLPVGAVDPTDAGQKP